MSTSVIRKITRGTETVSTSGTTITCNIVDVNKVFVILNCTGDSVVTSRSSSSSSYFAAGSTGVYLGNVTTTGITVYGYGLGTSTTTGNQSTISSSTIKISYQIIEFM